MGSRGPLPKPPALKALSGHPSNRLPRTIARRASDPDAPGRDRAPRPPATLKGQARKEWRRVVQVLRAEGLLLLTDEALLVAYCGAAATLHAALEALGDGEPLTSSGSHGGTIVRPEARLVGTMTAALAKLAGELGLSPAGKARLGVQTAFTRPGEAAARPPRPKNRLGNFI